jgi:hypothetical protein
LTGWRGDEAEYNLRQLRLATQALDGYLESRRTLVDVGRLVPSLEALEAAMESPDEEWRARFHDDLLTLETVYAVRLDRGGDLDDEDASLVDEAVGHLRTLVASAIESLEALAGEAA